MLVRRCDRSAKSDGALPAGWDADCVAFEAAVNRQWDSAVTIRELAIGGRALETAGYPPEQRRTALERLRDHVVRFPEENTEGRLTQLLTSLRADIEQRHSARRR